MSLPGLYAVVDAGVADASGWEALDLAAALFDGGVTLVQVRGKLLPSRDLLELSSQVARKAAAYNATVIVNDRADIAMLAGAAGVHLGQDDIPPADARTVVGARAIVGLSTHSASQIAVAAAEPIDYIAVGPVFATGTKDTGYEAVGLALVRHAAHTGRQIVAIGGVTLDRVASVIAAGAASVAVISDLLTGGNPTARARLFVEAAAAAKAAL